MKGTGFRPGFSGWSMAPVSAPAAAAPHPGAGHKKMKGTGPPVPLSHQKLTLKKIIPYDKVP